MLELFLNTRLMFESIIDSKIWFVTRWRPQWLKQFIKHKLFWFKIMSKERKIEFAYQGCRY